MCFFNWIGAELNQECDRQLMKIPHSATNRRKNTQTIISWIVSELKKSVALKWYSSFSYLFVNRNGGGGGGFSSCRFIFIFVFVTPKKPPAIQINWKIVTIVNKLDTTHIHTHKRAQIWPPASFAPNAQKAIYYLSMGKMLNRMRFDCRLRMYFSANWIDELKTKQPREDCAERRQHTAIEEKKLTERRRRWRATGKEGGEGAVTKSHDGCRFSLLQHEFIICEPLWIWFGISSVSFGVIAFNADFSSLHFSSKFEANEKILQTLT